MTATTDGQLNQVDLGAVSALVDKIRAPNPVEQLLAALGNCLAVGYAANASAAAVAGLHKKVAATSPVGQTLSKTIPVELSPA